MGLRLRFPDSSASRFATLYCDLAATFFCPSLRQKAFSEDPKKDLLA
jgi:hypothetical protein